MVTVLQDSADGANAVKDILNVGVMGKSVFTESGMQGRNDYALLEKYCYGIIGTFVPWLAQL
jgi:hypothetical protein